MILYITDDITTMHGGIIAHGCNCSGGFGSGVAGAIRKKWPIVYDRFKANGTGNHLLGTVDFIEVAPTIRVANMYTQEFYGRDGKRYADPLAIERALTEVIFEASNLGCLEEDDNIYMPKIGCGLGGLSWELDVEPIVNKLSQRVMLNIYVCEI